MSKIAGVIIGIDPSVDPAKCGYAVIGGKGLREYGTARNGAIPGVEDTATPLRRLFCLGQFLKSFGPDAVVIDVPRPFSYSRSSRGQQGLNQASLDRNHQAIGAILAGLDLPDSRIIRWDSSRRRTPKPIRQAWVCQHFGLDRKVSEHVADAIYFAAYVGGLVC